MGRCKVSKPVLMSSAARECFIGCTPFACRPGCSAFAHAVRVCCACRQVDSTSSLPDAAGAGQSFSSVRRLPVRDLLLAPGESPPDTDFARGLNAFREARLRVAAALVEEERARGRSGSALALGFLQSYPGGQEVLSHLERGGGVATSGALGSGTSGGGSEAAPPPSSGAMLLPTQHGAAASGATVQQATPASLVRGAEVGATTAVGTPHDADTYQLIADDAASAAAAAAERQAAQPTAPAQAPLLPDAEVGAAAPAAAATAVRLVPARSSDDSSDSSPPVAPDGGGTQGHPANERSQQQQQQQSEISLEEEGVILERIARTCGLGASRRAPVRSVSASDPNSPPAEARW